MKIVIRKIEEYQKLSDSEDGHTAIDDALYKLVLEARHSLREINQQSFEEARTKQESKWSPTTIAWKRVGEQRLMLQHARSSLYHSDGSVNALSRKHNDNSFNDEE